MPRTVQLFITSLLDSLYPDTCEAVVRVLALAGVEVHLADGQTCCGQPALNAALRADAHRMAMYTMRAFENAPGEVVVPPGSCADMIRYQYPELFADDAGWLSWHAYPALRSEVGLMRVLGRIRHYGLPDTFLPDSQSTRQAPLPVIDSKR